MNYVALLKEKNLKVTPQRLTIVEELYVNGHMNIDQLYHSLKSKFPSVSLATIYKNINAMTDIFFLSEVKIPHQKSVYELTKEEHSHVVCTQCQTIMDIDLDISQVLSDAKQLSSYSLDESAIIFNGICPKCK